ncbi:MAG: hypothetical protein IJO19_02395, partial [Clostridia bacterium]|nr:hypothetical protein [Clostridia bacterium]
MVEKENKYENKSRQKKKKTSKLMPILFITPLALTIIIASVFFVYYEQSKNVDDNEIVAKVNGLEITAAELSSKMAIDEEYVVNKFGKDYEEELNEDFWDLEVKDDDGNSTNPREYLQNMALKKLTAYKVEQQIAIENGIISESDAAYDAFLKNLKKANEGKSKKEKYSKKTYYEYVYKQLQKKNRVALSKKGKPLYASGSVLKEWFEKSNDEKYKKIDNFHFDIYYVYYDDKSNNYNKDAAV